MVAEQTSERRSDRTGMYFEYPYIQFYSPQNKVLGHSLLFNLSLVVNFLLLVSFQSIKKKYTI